MPIHADNANVVHGLGPRRWEAVRGAHGYEPSARRRLWVDLKLRRVEEPRPPQQVQPLIEDGNCGALEPCIGGSDLWHVRFDFEQRARIMALVQRIHTQSGDVCATWAEAWRRRRKRWIENAHLSRARGRPETRWAADGAEVDVKERRRTAIQLEHQRSLPSQVHADVGARERLRRAKHARFRVMARLTDG